MATERYSRRKRTRSRRGGGGEKRGAKHSIEIEEEHGNRKALHAATLAAMLALCLLFPCQRAKPVRSEKHRLATTVARQLIFPDLIASRSKI